MKIETKILKDYLYKVSLSATIPTINLSFTDDGVKTNVKELSGHAITMGFLKKESFEEYENIGDIFIKSSHTFLNVLKTFSDIVELEIINGIMIKISNDKREAYVMLTDKKICDNMIDAAPVVEAELTTNLEKSFLTTALNDMKLLGQDKVMLECKDNKLFIQVGEEKEGDFIVNSVDCECDKNVFVGIKAGFEETVRALSDNFVLKLATGKPIVIIDTDEYMEVATTIAPFVDNSRK